MERDCECADSTLRCHGDGLFEKHCGQRYAIYTKTQNDIEIVEPKAHGLGYFYPPTNSPEGWKQETPKWISIRPQNQPSRTRVIVLDECSVPRLSPCSELRNR